jgi:putative aldouronate transport system permease protein
MKSTVFMRNQRGTRLHRRATSVCAQKAGGIRGPAKRFFAATGKELAKNRYVYAMAVPVAAYFIIFKYIPMYGATIAFKDFSPGTGIFGSPWVGFKHFVNFFTSYYFGRLLRNTILISLLQLAFGFSAPILLALLMNELRNRAFKRTVQTISYLPHFISIMVICGILVDFLGRDGLVNDVIAFFGGKRANLLVNPGLFRPIYVGSGIWQTIGWESIIYLAALTVVDPQLYEAAVVDGAGRWKQAIHITLPGIMSMVVIMLILRLGQLMSVGFEKIILLYNPLTYETADVISTFVYRKGLQEAAYSYSAAVGLFNAIINFALLVSANWLSKRVSETSLW